jgi:hypothetical protein
MALVVFTATLYAESSLRSTMVVVTRRFHSSTQKKMFFLMVKSDIGILRQSVMDAVQEPKCTLR